MGFMTDIVKEMLKNKKHLIVVPNLKRKRQVIKQFNLTKEQAKQIKWFRKQSCVKIKSIKFDESNNELLKYKILEVI